MKGTRNQLIYATAGSGKSRMQMVTIAALYHLQKPSKVFVLFSSLDVLERDSAFYNIVHGGIGGEQVQMTLFTFEAFKDAVASKKATVSKRTLTILDEGDYLIFESQFETGSLGNYVSFTASPIQDLAIDEETVNDSQSTEKKLLAAYDYEYWETRCNSTISTNLPELTLDEFLVVGPKKSMLAVVDAPQPVSLIYCDEVQVDAIRLHCEGIEVN